MEVLKKKWFLLSSFLIVTVYVLITFISKDFSYFWDNIQYTSVTANWYYNNDFSSLVLPFYSEELKVVGAGSISFFGLATAFLWRVFGQEIWVSHFHILFWALILIYNTIRLLPFFLPKVFIPFILPVLLLESAILSQVAIASIDIVLLAMFVVALRSVLARKKWLLSLSVFLLITLSGRGLITGLGVYLFSLFHSFVQENEKPSFRFIIFKTLPFVPGFIFFATFFFYIQWFGNNVESPWKETWERPENIYNTIKNLFVFGLRLFENGRFIIWVTSFVLIGYGIRCKRMKFFLQGHFLSLGFLLAFFILVYLYYALTAKMIISTRYYMPMFFTLTVLLYQMLTLLSSMQFVKGFSIFVLFFLLTGHFWVYPEKIAHSWDATLAHIPYYELRKDCFNYIEGNNISFSDVSGGFCFSGQQRYMELLDRGLYISDNPNNKYFIYSNISNLSDDFIEEINNPKNWEKVKSFEKGFIFVSFYRNLNYKVVK